MEKISLLGFRLREGEKGEPGGLLGRGWDPLRIMTRVQENKPMIRNRDLPGK